MPNLLAKGLKGGLLAAVHDSMESLRFLGFRLDKQEFHGSLACAGEITD